MCQKLLVCVATVGASCAAFSQLTKAENAALDDTLAIANLTRSQLNWDRIPFSDSNRLKVIDDSLRDPLAGCDLYLGCFEKFGTQNLAEILGTIQTQLFKERVGTDPVFPDPELAAALPEALRAPIGKLAAKISLANSEIRAALGKESTIATERALFESMAQLAVEDEKTKFDFVTQRPQPISEVARLMEKVDGAKLQQTAIWLSKAVTECVGELKLANADLSSPVDLTLSGIKVRVFGKRDDTNATTDALLCIDLGGDDTYTGRIGVGVRYAAVSIDLGGDDLYRCKDLSCGAASLGIGIHYDVAGDDRYEGKNLQCGAALGGVGVLVDTAGNDHYRHETTSQAFSMFGCGLVIDLFGEDLYDLGFYGQGCARTNGVALLVDRVGRDIYRAGGSLLNSPLFSDVNYSFAQGCGMGYREDTGGVSGGVGLLADYQGDDSYLSETYAQAASYWFSTGALFDAQGHDTYSGYHYAQSSAMHMCSAYLIDLSGNDLYGMKFGASHAIGHDYGVAMLLDRKGDDIYAAKDSQPGIGNANGIGIFLDSAGDDRYQGPVGIGNAARSTGSLGIFTDMSGQDVYRTGLTDGGATIATTWGVAYDFPTIRNLIEGPSATPPRPLPGSIKAPSDSEMEKIYALATQWGVGTAQSAVEENVAKLVGIGIAAANWMLDKKLSGASRLEIRAFVEVIRDVGADARNALAIKVLKGSLAEKRNGLGIAVEGGFKEVAPAVSALISEPTLQLQAVRAAGVLRSTESVSKLLPLAARNNLVGTAAMISLSQIGDEQAYSTAEALLGTANLLVRKAAINLMAQFPLRALDTGKRLTSEGRENSIRLGIELLGAIDSTEALNEVGSRLLDPIPGVRVQALLALHGKCPESYRLTFLSLRGDPDPIVRCVATNLDPGR